MLPLDCQVLELDLLVVFAHCQILSTSARHTVGILSPNDSVRYTVGHS